MIKLQLRDQPERFVGLASRTVTIGRDASNDLTIDDASVSDFHAEVQVGDEVLEIIDLLSATGTFVNEHKVGQRCGLKAWDVIRLGNVLLEVNDPTINRPGDWALRSESDLLAGQFFPLSSPTIVGRGIECDLKIDDATLSRRHSELTIRGDLLHVRDLGSANGVFANEVRVDQAELRPGDRLRLGSRSFLVVGPAANPPTGRRSEDATVIQGDGSGPHTEILADPRSAAYLIEQTHYLGDDGRVALHGARYRVGRDGDNDLVIADTSISRIHAMLVSAAGGWRIQDMQSSNGVVVNGERQEAAALRDGDEIRLGRAVFVYHAAGAQS